MKRVLTVNFIVVIEKLIKDLGLDSTSAKYVLYRTRCEGITFLTKTLPLLAKSVLVSIERGYFGCPDSMVGDNRPTNFAWEGASLKYFRVWLDEIFCPKSGLLLARPCPYALKSIRQLCEYAYKLVLPFGDDELVYAEEKILENEVLMDSELDLNWVDTLRVNFETLYPEISRTTVDKVFGDHRPRFGPGAFAGSTQMKEKFFIYKNLSDSEVGTTSSTFRAMSGFFKPYPSSPEAVNIVKEDKISEIVIVPKDSRGPRVISKEPMHLLRGQMAYFDWLSKNLQKCSNKRINFTDQSINQELARESSITRQWATLDLKDASDMVRSDLARAVFRESPAIRWFLLNARSTHTRLPFSKNVIELRKLSGMGSGITFPTMALLIQLSIVSSVHSVYKHLSLKQIARHVYVYGDDIIIPTQWVGYARRGLEASGLRINADKSYYRSQFRESCGGDYLSGVSVSPVRLRMSNGRIRPLKNRSIRVIQYEGDGAILQLERHCRELVKNGFLNLANYYYKQIEYALNTKLSTVSGTTHVLGRYTPTFAVCDYRYMAKKMYVPSVRNTSNRYTSPYKYLSRFFSLTAEDSWQGRFGVFANPRDVKLEVKLVTPFVAAG